MDRMVPLEADEPVSATGGSAARSTIYVLLAAMLLAAVWLRFNGLIAAIDPTLAGPPALVGSQAADPSGVRDLVELGLLPAGQASAAVAAMGLPPTDAAALTQALQRGRLRLARLPLLDGTSLEPGQGHIVQVSSAGFTRQVVLTREPTVVTLPVGPVANIEFRTSDSAAVGIVGLTLAGPIRLPDLQAGQVLTVGVVAQ
jgi:hypothetical protein